MIECNLKKVAKKEWTLEQLLINDHDYFQFVINNLSNYRHITSMKKLEYIANNFVPQIECKMCDEPMHYLSIAGTHKYGYSISTDFGYCSNACLTEDPAANATGMQLYPANFSTLKYFSNKKDKKQLANVLLKVMGFSGKKSKEKLYDLFKNIETI